MPRHDEKAGLMEARRADKGYRSSSDADLRRTVRIRDLIATGFSTLEVLAMAPCLSDEGAGPCEGGIPQLLHKLEQIDRLRADLDTKRNAVLDRLAGLREVLSRRTHVKTQPANAGLAPPDRATAGHGR